MRTMIFGAGTDLGVNIDGASLGPVQLMNDLKVFYKGESMMFEQDKDIIKRLLIYAKPYYKSFILVLLESFSGTSRSPFFRLPEVHNMDFKNSLSGTSGTPHPGYPFISRLF